MNALRHASRLVRKELGEGRGTRGVFLDECARMEAELGPLKQPGGTSPAA